MRFTTISFICGFLFLLCGCNKDNGTHTPITARDVNIFGQPVGTENCKPVKLIRHSASGNDTSLFNYNVYGLLESIIKPGIHDTVSFFYNAANMVVKINETINNNTNEWRFEYNNTGGKASRFYHSWQGSSGTLRDTFAVTYPNANMIIISVKHPFADSTFRDSIELNSNYNPVKFTRNRRNNTDGNTTRIMQLNYSYGTALNPLTAEASVWNWIDPLYTNMRLLISNPGNNFTSYFPGIIPFGKNLEQSYNYTGLGVSDFNGTVSSVLTNTGNYPTSFVLDAAGETGTFSFEYNCQ